MFTFPVGLKRNLARYSKISFRYLYLESKRGQDGNKKEKKNLRIDDIESFVDEFSRSPVKTKLYEST